jgi:hypothetical protein
MNNSQETTTTTTKITTNDDGEALVQQILDENPSEEAGVREEWKDHIGWHRQEDIRGDRVVVQTPHDHEQQQQQQQQYQQQQQRLLRGSKWMKHGETHGELSSEASLLGYLALLLGLISVVLLCLLLLDWIRFRMRNRLFSPRKNR